jgi:hypothetical protein
MTHSSKNFLEELQNIKLAHQPLLDSSGGFIDKNMPKEIKYIYDEKISKHYEDRHDYK